MGFQQMLQLASRDADSSGYNDIYNGAVRLSSLGVSLPAEVRVLEMTAPYPRLSVDVLVEVLTPEGFLCEDHDAQIEDLRLVWQANDMDSKVKLAETESLVRGTCYFTVSKDPGGRVRVQVLTPDSATVETDGFGNTVEGIWVFRAPSGVETAVYYVPGETLLMEYRLGQWVIAGRVATGSERPMIVGMPNRTRIDYARGVSELEQIIAISDGASRSLTNLQVAQEMLAMPLRAILNDEISGRVEKQMTGEQRRKFKIEAAMGGMLVAPRDSELKQLPGADLNPIIASVKLYAQIISAMTGIPPSMLGITTDNPTSAEAMRAAKERLITRAESKQALFGDALESLALLMLDAKGVDTSGMDTIECVWRDPATPSVAAKAANALQAQAQGVISAETAREFLNLTPEQKRRETLGGGSLAGLEGLMDDELKRLDGVVSGAREGVSVE